MEKTTVYLTTEQKAALTEAALTEGRSEARLIRDGIEQVLEGHRTGEAAIPLGGHAPAARKHHEQIPERPRWIGRDEFVRQFAGAQADPNLLAELRKLSPDTTDDLPAR